MNTAAHRPAGSPTVSSGRSTCSQQRRAQVITAASTCFAEHGFHGTSMAMIAAASGLSNGSLYHFFENKEAIIEAIVKSNVECFTAMLEALHDDAGDASQQLPRLLEQVVTGVDRNTARLRLEILAEAGRNTKIATIAQSADARIRQTISEVLLGAAPTPLARAQITVRVDLIAAVLDSVIARLAWSPDVTTMDVRALLDAALA